MKPSSVYKPWSFQVRVKSRCDYLAMSADQSFLNAITVNLDIQDSLKRRVQSAQGSFAALRERLDELLGSGSEGEVR